MTLAGDETVRAVNAALHMGANIIEALEYLGYRVEEATSASGGTAFLTVWSPTYELVTLRVHYDESQRLQVSEEKPHDSSA